jgi:aspartate/methionine/tyrosine aminotransferase
VVRPEATALGFVRYHLDLPSRRVAEELSRQGGVLVAPGAHFGTEGHIRITHGHEPAYLTEALDRVSAVLQDLSTATGKRDAG